jgi:hypothetical protein
MSKSKPTGFKASVGKPRMSLISHIAVRKIAHVMTDGAKKYSDNQWRNGFVFTDLMDALERHSGAYLAGQKADPQSGYSHLAHLGASVMMLLELEETRPDLYNIYQIPNIDEILARIDRGPEKTAAQLAKDEQDRAAFERKKNDAANE